MNEMSVPLPADRDVTKLEIEKRAGSRICDSIKVFGARRSARSRFRHLFDVPFLLPVFVITVQLIIVGARSPGEAVRWGG
jgi:hypothetical protein